MLQEPEGEVPKGGTNKPELRPPAEGHGQYLDPMERHQPPVPRNVQTPEALANRHTEPGPLSNDEMEQLSNDAEEFINNLNSIKGYAFSLDLFKGRLNIDPNIGKRFDAHGIVQGTQHDMLEALQYLLVNGVDKNRPFYHLPLKRDPLTEHDNMIGDAAGPYAHGAFIIVSKPDGSLSKDGVDSVIVNEQFYDAIPTLVKHFPHIYFIKPDEAPTKFARILVEKDIIKDK